MKCHKANSSAARCGDVPTANNYQTAACCRGTQHASPATTNCQRHALTCHLRVAAQPQCCRLGPLSRRQAQLSSTARSVRGTAAAAVGVAHVPGLRRRLHRRQVLLLVACVAAAAQLMMSTATAHVPWLNGGQQPPAAPAQTQVQACAHTPHTSSGTPSVHVCDAHCSVHVKACSQKPTALPAAAAQLRARVCGLPKSTGLSHWRDDA